MAINNAHTKANAAEAAIATRHGATPEPHEGFIVKSSKMPEGMSRPLKPPIEVPATYTPIARDS